MGALAVGDVISVAFPFSDLSTKKRPALVVARADNDDVILCQITSRTYSSRTAIAIDAADFASGGLPVASFARPGKLFTASETIALAKLGVLTEARIGEVRATIAALFN